MIISNNLRSFAPTLCEALGVNPPEFATHPAYLDLGDKKGRIKKALIYCPDAFGNHALKKFPKLHQEIVKYSTHEAALYSIFPSVTPVCFASLFTGATPEQHGILHYEKKVLTCDTVFDALIRAGKKVAIVAVKNSSIDVLFRDRELDYFSMDYDPLVSAKALELIANDEHDVIVVYHQEYDDLLHDSGVFTELSVKALVHHVETWEMLVRVANAQWNENYLVAFTPDHGAHTDETTGRGDHGLDTAEDMELKHFFYLN